jgi:hypothetical protein
MVLRAHHQPTNLLNLANLANLANLGVDGYGNSRFQNALFT